MELSRRTFVAASGAAGLACGAALSAGAPAAHADETFDETFDVIVVGAGNAGCAAAITVGEEGDGATCLLAEKGDTPGGVSAYSNNAYLYTTPEERDLLSEYIKHLCGDFGIDDETREAFVDGLEENLDWILSLGIDDDLVLRENAIPDEGWLPEYYEFPESEGIIRTSKIYENADKTNNTYLHQFLLNKAQTYSTVEYRPSAQMTELIQDPGTGAVVGAVIGGKRIGANKGVVVAAGGFESNPQMMEDYLGQGHAIPAAAPLNTGEAITACQKVGAQLWHMNAAAGFWMAPRDLEDTMFMVGGTKLKKYKKMGITVGVNGRRFYMDSDAHDVKFTDDDDKYTLLSTHVGSRHGRMQFGGDWASLPMPPKAWFVFDQAGMDGGAFNTDMSDDPEADGWVYKADTIEELEAALEIPEGELVRTVQEWNDACDAGEDLYFFRPTGTLNPVRTAPFYAMLCRPSFLNTDGGPKRDGRCQVLDLDDRPIEGLYSAGEFGSFWGHYYQGGGNNGECLATGRIAARQALARA